MDVEAIFANKRIKPVNAPNYYLYNIRIESLNERRIFWEATKNFTKSCIVNRIDEHRYFADGIVTEEIKNTIERNRIGMEAVEQYRKFSHNYGIDLKGQVY